MPRRISIPKIEIMVVRLTPGAVKGDGRPLTEASAATARRFKNDDDLVWAPSRERHPRYCRDVEQQG